MERAEIERIVAAIADRLPGDWLLVGGGLVALWLEPRRVTEDVDVIGLSGRSDDRLALMELASDLGLPIEALNSAADFFVHRIPGWRDELEVLRRGAVGTIFRPTPTLFLLLKIGRLSPQDLDDALAAIERASAWGLALDRDRVLAALAALPPVPPEGEGRRLRLREALAAPRPGT